MLSKNANNPRVEKAKSSDAWIWGGWSRSSENIQESRSNDPTSEGLHIVSIDKVLQVQKTMILLIKHNPKGCTMKSRMNREVHVRFCERFRGEIPLYLLDLFCFFTWYFYFVAFSKIFVAVDYIFVAVLKTFVAVSNIFVAVKKYLVAVNKILVAVNNILVAV